ncbi:MAG: EamA family transporter [Crocinitomicaceae bacterium]|nr:EamA family transporter [Crocinitomicaceae bacterium]
MLDILLGVLAFNAVLIIFKYLSQYKVDNLQALFYNYLIAGICGIYYSRELFSIETLTQSSFSLFGFLIGGLFIASFLFLAVAAQKIGMGVATTANKMSVIFPILAAFAFLNEVVTSQKVLGIVLALIAVYLATKTKREGKVSWSEIGILLVIFVGQGIADIFFNLASAWYVKGEEKGLFFTCIFLAAALIGLIVIVYRVFSGKSTIQLKALPWGVSLGILNFCTLYFFFSALESQFLDSSQIYPIFNMAIILIAAIAGFIWFKEKLSLTNWIGIGIAIISILLLGFNF